MRVDVAFTSGDAVEGTVGVVMGVLRATSTIAQALDAGYPRVLRCPRDRGRRAVREELGEGLLGGEGDAVSIPGVDVVGTVPRRARMVGPAAEIVLDSTFFSTGFPQLLWKNLSPREPHFEGWCPHLPAVRLRRIRVPTAHRPARQRGLRDIDKEEEKVCGD